MASNRADAEEPDSWLRPYLPCWYSPHEFTEMIGPEPSETGCIHGPPEAPPESPQLGSQQLAAP